MNLKCWPCFLPRPLSMIAFPPSCLQGNRAIACGGTPVDNGPLGSRKPPLRLVKALNWHCERGPAVNWVKSRAFKTAVFQFVRFNFCCRLGQQKYFPIYGSSPSAGTCFDTEQRTCLQSAVFTIPFSQHNTKHLPFMSTHCLLAT